MALDMVSIGGVQVSRLAIGGNAFSGFSHQGAQRDSDFRKYYRFDKIKEALFKAEAAGINTFFGRADNHVMRLMEEYWDEGGKIQWFAQSASERPDYVRNIQAAADVGAKGMYLHGGVVDVFYRNGQFDDLRKAVDLMHSRGMAGGLAAHRWEPHEWVRDNMDVEFQLTCYYDPSPRTNSPHHVVTDHEKFDPAHRDRMAQTIQTLKAPAVHYKVLAAGRTPADEAFSYVANIIRPQDVVLVGFYLGDDEDLIGKTAKLFEQIVQGRMRRSIPAGAVAMPSSQAAKQPKT